MKKSPEELYQFPCTLNFKIIAKRHDDIENAIRDILTEQGFDLKKTEIQIRPSRNNQYWALTVPLEIESKEQLDALHKAVNAHHAVVMTL